MHIAHVFSFSPSPSLTVHVAFHNYYVHVHVYIYIIVHCTVYVMVSLSLTSSASIGFCFDTLAFLCEILQVSERERGGGGEGGEKRVNEKREGEIMSKDGGENEVH